jgi:hypothetical protein
MGVAPAAEVASGIATVVRKVGANVRQTDVDIT